MRHASHLLTFAAGLGLAAAAGLALHLDPHTLPRWGGSEAQASDAPATPGAGLPLPQAPLSFAPLVDAASPAVVSVYVSKTVELQGQQGFPFFFGPMPQLPEGFKQEGTGSGFIISEDGFILTNNHVVEDATEVKVQLAGGDELDARVVGTDPEIDVALLKVEARGGLPHLALGSSEGLRVGDWVVAIGNPLDYDHTVTAGIVSAKGRILGASSYDDFIQTDAAINPGNSGGPLLNTAGRVVGINTAISRMGQGLAFAVPIDMVKSLIDDLKDDGKVSRGWLGISMQPVDDDMAEALGLDAAQGALVSVVHEGTPAEQAGLKAGDVVLSLEGEAIADSNALLHAVGKHHPGERVRLDVLRDGKHKEVTVALGERPSRDDLAAGRWTRGGEAGEDEEVGGVAKLGITLVPGNAATMGRRNAVDHPVVASVDDDGPADGKLREGDVLLQVGGQDVTTVAQAEQALGRARGVVLLTVERGGSPLFVAVRVP
ncbi:MAG: Do family serine endopeptidase [Pseudomonadota bacterium]